MKIIYPKALTDGEMRAVNEISLKCGILRDTARLLYERGISDVTAAKRFLEPSKKHFSDPFGLSGMSCAVERINAAKERGERVLVFGDYDADGICATTILCGCLKKFGITADFAIPEREEGYGLNENRVLSLNAENKIGLVITVDCGISDADKIRVLKENGIDVIVTDHHEPPEILPDCICINPKIKGQEYGFDGLCGGGVAYKLGFALIGEKADEYLDFAALATVADSMDLVGENRDIVAEGLKIINTRPRVAFMAFLGDSRKEVTAQTLAYLVAPRVNAGGRMGDAFTALKMFLSDDENEIFDLAVKLNVYNATRQSLCEEAYAYAKRTVVETGANADKIILVRGEQWNAGILGIVAAKLAETFNKPIIVFAGGTGVYKGSARSVEGINIYDAISAAKEYLVSFGGHAQAAGLSVTEENFEPFRRAVNDYAEKVFGKEEREKEIFVDVKADGAIPIRLAEEIELLEPFGVGNRRPLFSTEVGETVMTPLKENSPHYSFDTEAVEMLDFNGAKDVTTLAFPVKKTLVFELNLSTFKSRTSVKGFLRNIVCEFGDFTSLGTDVFKREIHRRGDGNVPKTVKCEIEKGYGTAYVISDVRSAEKLKDSGLKIYPYEIKDETGRNCIVISPEVIPDTYKEVIYLDKPVYYCDFCGRAKKSDEPLCDVAAGLLTDRKVFADAFSEITGGIKSSMKDFFAKTLENKSEEEKRQFLFCYEVFSELGFFVVKNGLILRDNAIRKPLGESTLYRTVRERQC